MKNTVHTKIIDLYNGLNVALLERTEVLKGCILALLAQKHLFMIGPPGTAKSQATEKVCKATKGAKYFEWLMDRFTKPDDLFGPYKLSELKNDRLTRNTDGMLPQAHIVFLDEVWKASGSILNTLLRVMDETRRFYNNGSAVQTPLISLFGASNELPEDESLNALYDRFILRYFVGDIVDDTNFKFLLNLSGTATSPPGLTMEELSEAQDAVKTLPFGKVVDSITELRRRLSKDGFEFSPRRWKESIRVLQANAWFDGRDAVTLMDLDILSNILWNKPDDRRTVLRIISEFINPEAAKALEYLDEAAEIYKNMGSDPEEEAELVEANGKLKRLIGEVKKIEQTPKVVDILEQIGEMQKSTAKIILGV